MISCLIKHLHFHVFIFIISIMVFKTGHGAQLEIQLPDNTPHNSTIFITGNWKGCDWRPNCLKIGQVNSSSNLIKYNFSFNSNAEFKITRGGWHNEAIYQNFEQQNLLIKDNIISKKIVIKNWADHPSKDDSDVHVIAKLPGNTPTSDSIFIFGNFNGNNWNEGQLQMWPIEIDSLKNGNPNLFESFINTRGSTNIEFKITRGSWITEASDVYGNALTNNFIGNRKKIVIDILNWKDLGAQSNIGNIKIIPLSKIIGESGISCSLKDLFLFAQYDSNIKESNNFLLDSKDSRLLGFKFSLSNANHYPLNYKSKINKESAILYAQYFNNYIIDQKDFKESISSLSRMDKNRIPWEEKLFRCSVDHILGYEKKLFIRTPNDLSHEDKNYPLLIAHDGHNKFSPQYSNYQKSWRLDFHMDRLVKLGKIRDAFIVGISSDQKQKKRYQEYTHSMLGDFYSRMIIEHVIPYMKNNYPVSDNSEDHLLIGSSMGAVINLELLLSHSEHFYKAAGLSFPVCHNKYIKNLMSNKNFKRPSSELFFYLDHGDMASEPGYKDNAQILHRRLLKGKIIKPTNFEYLEFPYGKHTEADWERRVSYALTFLLGV